MRYGGKENQAIEHSRLDNPPAEEGGLSKVVSASFSGDSGNLITEFANDDLRALSSEDSPIEPDHLELSSLKVLDCLSWLSFSRLYGSICSWSGVNFYAFIC